MNWKSGKKIFTALCMLILFTACGSNSTGGDSTPGGSRLPVEGACANEFFPAVQGAAWTYESKGSPAGNYTFTDTISAVRSDGFTLTSKYGNDLRPEDWSCTEAGLVALRLGGPATTTLKSQDMNFEFQFKNVQGLSIPVQINPGDVWTKSLEFDGKMEIAGEPASAAGNSQAEYKAIGIEEVRVPAGTFQALKVQSENNIVFTIQVQGISVPVSFSGTYDYWFAKGVGWVKAEGKGNVTGISFTETIELQSYKIP